LRHQSAFELPPLQTPSTAAALVSTVLAAAHSRPSMPPERAAVCYAASQSAALCKQRKARRQWQPVCVIASASNGITRSCTAWYMEKAGGMPVMLSEASASPCSPPTACRLDAVRSAVRSFLPHRLQSSQPTSVSWQP
jgi:hypothetical protein